MLTDITALLAAIDAGDDSALLPLADALEEAGDARAAGVRRVGDRRPSPSRDGLCDSDWEWRLSAIVPLSAERRDTLLLSHFDSLAGGRRSHYIGQAGRAYPTLSAAYLVPLASARSDR